MRHDVIYSWNRRFGESEETFALPAASREVDSQAAARARIPNLGHPNGLSGAHRNTCPLLGRSIDLGIACDWVRRDHVCSTRTRAHPTQK